VVRWVSAEGVPTWEPAKDDVQSANGLNQVYEGLTQTDADLSLHPALATSWTLVRPDLWRFELRQDAHFHDGTPLTTEDVVFSLARAGTEGSDYVYVADAITAVTAPDEHTIEITTKRPELRLPSQLKTLRVISKAWAERHRAEHPARRDDTAAYAFAHANGTGPFMLESFDPASKRVVLVRSPGWWGLAAYPHSIDRIVWTVEPDPERRLALRLDGGADFLQDPPPDRLDRLRGAPGIKLAQTNALLTIFLGPDQGSNELRTSDVKGRNPFKDRRVRQAVYQAVDVDTLIAQELGGLAVPAGMVAAPGVNGYDPELDRRLPYDPERAKVLLAEAGYPDGFAVRLDCGENCRKVRLGLAAQLAAVGLRVTPDVQPFETFKARISTRATDLYLGSEQASFTLDSAEPLREVFHDPPSYWVGATGYANPALNGLDERIDAEVSSPIRDALIEQAWRVVLNDTAVVPLYRPLVVWAMRDTLELPIVANGVPRLRQARLTSPR